MRQTFVFEGTEVVKTGRVAVKQRRTRSSATAPAPALNMTLVEITPVDSTFDWRKWVSEDALYVVETKNEEQ